MAFRNTPLGLILWVGIIGTSWNTFTIKRISKSSRRTVKDTSMSILILEIIWVFRTFINASHCRIISYISWWARLLTVFCNWVSIKVLFHWTNLNTKLCCGICEVISRTSRYSMKIFLTLLVERITKWKLRALFNTFP